MFTFIRMKLHWCRSAHCTFRMGVTTYSIFLLCVRTVVDLLRIYLCYVDFWGLIFYIENDTIDFHRIWSGFLVFIRIRVIDEDLLHTQVSFNNCGFSTQNAKAIKCETNPIIQICIRYIGLLVFDFQAAEIPASHSVWALHALLVWYIRSKTCRACVCFWVRVRVLAFADAATATENSDSTRKTKVAKENYYQHMHINFYEFLSLLRILFCSSNTIFLHVVQYCTPVTDSHTHTDRLSTLCGMLQFI